MNLLMDASYDKRGVMDIQQSQVGMQKKCENVLELWARKSGSKWEDVIAALRKVGMSRLADELMKEHDQSQNEFQARKSEGND